MFRKLTSDFSGQTVPVPAAHVAPVLVNTAEVKWLHFAHSAWRQRSALTWLQSTPVVVLVGTALEEAAQCSARFTARRAHLKAATSGCFKHCRQYRLQAPSRSLNPTHLPAGTSAAFQLHQGTLTYPHFLKFLEENPRTEQTCKHIFYRAYTFYLHQTSEETLPVTLKMVLFHSWRSSSIDFLNKVLH